MGIFLPLEILADLEFRKLQMHLLQEVKMQGPPLSCGGNWRGSCWSILILPSSYNCCLLYSTISFTNAM
jgi:hypothetical protein